MVGQVRNNGDRPTERPTPSRGIAAGCRLVTAASLFREKEKPGAEALRSVGLWFVSVRTKPAGRPPERVLE